jgi:hypothetical protein
LVCWELDLISVEVVSNAYLYDENHKSVLHDFVHMHKASDCESFILYFEPL